MAFFICFLTGHLKSFLIITLITFIHELGHLSAAFYYKWNIEKVLLLPFGALSIFKEDINRPLKEEFIILILGPLFQIVFVNLYLHFNYSENIEEINNMLLIFNLLPIFPLDGSKLINIILNKVTSFKKSHILTLYLSFLFIFIIVFKTNFNLVVFITLVFTFFKVMEEYIKRHQIFNRFLLERYMGKYKFKKEIIINNINDMKRDHRHLFREKNTYITEKEKLKKRFDFK